MQTKNLYYQQVFQRRNFITHSLLPFFLSICSWPRLILEVFLRKNQGERYFSVLSVFTVASLLAIYPAVANKTSSAIGAFDDYGGYRSTRDSFWSTYATWYLFLIAFVCFGILRWREVMGNPSVFDFKRFSLSSGTINPLFYKMPFEKNATPRMIEIFYEPALFFVLGMLLWGAGQSLGRLFMFSSLIYGLSYAAAYKMGDDFVMDKIDEGILNEELENAFVYDMDSEQTRGFRFYGRKPNGEDLRRKVSESFIEIVEEEESLAR